MPEYTDITSMTGTRIAKKVAKANGHLAYI